jgi:tetratricopeptide (TPR) repeat protein
MRLLIFAIIMFAATSCNETPVEENNSNVLPDAETALIEVQEIEASLLKDEELNPEKGWQAFGAFRAFARNYPGHPLAPGYHMKAAAIARNIPGKALMAIEQYMYVYKNYPEDTLAPQAEFLIGYTFDQALNDHERAIKAYGAFIEHWPDHPLAEQAKNLVAMLEKDEDILNQLKSWKK